MEKKISLSWSQAVQIATILLTIGGLIVTTRLSQDEISYLKSSDKIQIENNANARKALKEELLKEIKYLEDKHTSDNATLHRRISTTNEEVKEVTKEVHRVEVKMSERHPY